MLNVENVETKFPSWGAPCSQYCASFTDKEDSYKSVRPSYTTGQAQGQSALGAGGNGGKQGGPEKALELPSRDISPLSGFHHLLSTGLGTSH